VSFIFTGMSQGCPRGFRAEVRWPRDPLMRSKKRDAEGSFAPVRSRAPADCVQAILATKSLTLYKVSALTRVRYPREAAYHIPRNFYFQLRSAGLSPKLQQLYAFGQLSGYRFADWLAVFGFSLDEIPRLQASLDHPRTMLFDTSVYDAGAAVPWFRDRANGGVLPPVAPLSQLLEVTGLRRLSLLMDVNRTQYLYAKIGRQDAFAFPDLLPGSIVRANPRPVERLLPKPGEVSKHFFLIEHSRGFSCCRLHLGTKDRVTLAATELPFASVELQLESEARILGVLDMEFRPLTNHRHPAAPLCALPEVAPDLAKLWTPASLKRRSGKERPALLIRNARFRAGLSFRRASEMSRTVATALRDKRYFTSAGSLSDLEARDTPPRHIHKLLTVCTLYSVRFGELLSSFGLEWDEGGMAAIPDEWMPRRPWAAPGGSKATTSNSGFLANALERIGEVPFFLRHSLAFLSGFPEISLRDVFWLEGQPEALHPSLTGALFVIVNRRKRKPQALRWKSTWEQPLYLLRKRDESYLLASCSLENSEIVVHPHTESFVRPERLHNRVDAEVVGQIVTIVRSLPGPP
jgi:hypothetical protein